ATAYVRGRGQITPFGNIGTCRNDAPPGVFAVQPDLHDAVRVQQIHQCPPSPCRVGEVVEYADALYGMKTSPSASKPQDVALAVPDIIDAVFPRFANGICQAGEAQIDGEHLGILVEGGRGDGVLPRATAGDEYVRRCK